MQEKEWMGAELIFDLDSDHLPNADKMRYEESLALVNRNLRNSLRSFSSLILVLKKNILSSISVVAEAIIAM